ncbi:hypothetical protein [Sorangium cellulosum]|uniref:hypothetical protein n=1 Tax=Sorangium cellulosum TaxID=56 RepID=UPI000CF403B1|nr:hypothetical protein [Sorangium cellulosum]
MTWKFRAPLGAAVAGLAGAALLAPAPAAAAPNEATHQRTAIPAYWGADTAGGAEMFARLAQNVPTNDVVVLNGSASKPEYPFNQALAKAIEEIHDAGAMALVYVDSGYYGFFPPVAPHSTRPDGPGGGGSSVADWTAQIQQDIDDWYALYGAYGGSSSTLPAPSSTSPGIPSRRTGTPSWSRRPASTTPWRPIRRTASTRRPRQAPRRRA